MPYAEHVPSQDPDKDVDTVEDECLRAWFLLKRGWSYDEIAVDIGVSRRTVARRLEKLMLALGDLGGPVRRMVELDRLEKYTRKIDEAMDAELTPGDLSKLIGAGARVSDARLKLLAPVDETSPANDDPEVEQWVQAARVESEAELEKVRNGEAAS